MKDQGTLRPNLLADPQYDRSECGITGLLNRRLQRIGSTGRRVPRKVFGFHFLIRVFLSSCIWSRYTAQLPMCVLTSSVVSQIFEHLPLVNCPEVPVIEKSVKRRDWFQLVESRSGSNGLHDGRRRLHVHRPEGQALEVILRIAQGQRAFPCTDRCLPSRHLRLCSGQDTKR